MQKNKIDRSKEPTRIPVRYSDGDYENPCPFGVQKDGDLEIVLDTCPVCGPNCSCGCLEGKTIAGAGGPTCRACVYHVQILDEQVICYNPGIPEQL